MTLAKTKAEAERLRQVFEAAGAQTVDCAILQPAETLLDLYGEDIRTRAYVTHDPAQGEVMLRPDFTVPVVQMHMSGGAEPARYTYSGEVFRRQEQHPDRSSEYFQVGYEVFDGTNPEAADAEVFARIAAQLAGVDLRPVTGDLGILIAAVQGLKASDRRRAALMRHIWRPRRFRALMERFSGKAAIPPSRAALLNAADPFAKAGPQIGMRSWGEIAERVENLKADSAEGNLSQTECEMIEAIVNVRETCSFALEQLRDIAVDMPVIHDAVERFARRCAALDAEGQSPDAIDFEGSYGRTSMEYYGGFVFGFYAAGRPDLPPVATGGRYDALTAVLGQGTSIPAVGGVIRPGILLTVKGAGA
ncbi:ATP phosphoribosyltransferase regulatory subunit [Pseudoprimorskyibacter insulae]|uniref:ATP phosphoribosyltransferase regulatory subunit n=1 Tax=Pseudoprimorskyibacter insulae TaxID=1695997 RepID=A0A2R8AVH2_9RHOB|nr:ATP phosphoribosyltransferase regulatory subunit [Pseudoprimorskyibacter insulae]SPF80025.1 ATP phosphoribosyltransferase regulatory subunit [Pseudoprimorskyibacter insulae]